MGQAWFPELSPHRPHTSYCKKAGEYLGNIFWYIVRVRRYLLHKSTVGDNFRQRTSQYLCTIKGAVHMWDEALIVVMVEQTKTAAVRCEQGWDCRDEIYWPLACAACAHYLLPLPAPPPHSITPSLHHSLLLHPSERRGVRYWLRDVWTQRNDVRRGEHDATHFNLDWKQEVRICSYLCMKSRDCSAPVL